MTELIACLSTGKGTWLPVIKLIEAGEWGQVFVVATEFAKEKYQPKKSVNFIIISPERELNALVEDIRAQLDNKLQGTEVALNINSGSGKEHMALIAALLKLGVGIRLVHLDKSEVSEL